MNPHDAETIIAAWLGDGPTHIPDATRDAIVGRIRAMPQRRPTRLPQPAWPFRRPLRVAASAAMVMVIAVAVIALIAFPLATGERGGLPPGSSPTLLPASAAPTATPAASGPPVATASPAPRPAADARADRFVRPFEYGLPPGSALALTRASSGMYAWTEGSTDAYPGAGYTPVSNVRGLTVSFGSTPTTHVGGGRAVLSLGPASFLEDLRGNPNVTVGPITSTELDGRAALQADVEGAPAGPPEGYPDIHMGGGSIGDAAVLALAFPGRLIVAEVEGGSLLVHIWAASAEELEAWLPIATKIVSSIRFLPSATPSSQTPEPTEAPVASANPSTLSPSSNALSPGRHVLQAPATGVGSTSWPTGTVSVEHPGDWVQSGRERAARLSKAGMELEAGTVTAVGCWNAPVAVGPSVDDLAAAVSARVGGESTVVGLGRFAGRLIVATVPVDGSLCFGWQTPPDNRGGHWGPTWKPGSTHRMWILDVDGTRFVIDASYDATTSADLQIELANLVESIEFELP